MTRALADRASIQLGIRLDGSPQYSKHGLVQPTIGILSQLPALTVGVGDYYAGVAGLDPWTFENEYRVPFVPHTSPLGCKTQPEPRGPGSFSAANDAPRCRAR
jgi:hypothetical protein